MTSYLSKYPSRIFQWGLLLFVFVITIINYLDRAAIAYAILPIEKIFQLNNQDFGFIASGFGFGYFIACFAAGVLVDRFGSIKIWALCAALWSIATILIGFSKGFWSLFFLRTILGVAEAVHFPALLKTITNWLNPNLRSRCIAFGLLGVPVASVIGAPLLSFIMQEFGWQWMFWVFGTLGIIWAVCFPIFSRKLYSFRHTAKNPHDVFLETSVLLGKEIPWKKIFHSRLFWGNCFNYFIFGYIVFFGLIWFPGYLEKIFKIGILKTGKLLIFPWALSAILLFLGGIDLRPHLEKDKINALCSDLSNCCWLFARGHQFFFYGTLDKSGGQYSSSFLGNGLCLFCQCSNL